MALPDMTRLQSTMLSQPSMVVKVCWKVPLWSYSTPFHSNTPQVRVSNTVYCG